MQIIHIKGTQCSGKTYTVAPFINRPDVAYWDILSLYYKEGCIQKNGLMDWNKWQDLMNQLPDIITNFIKSSEDKTIIIESGTNETVNTILSNYDVLDIELTVPDEKTLITRAKERGLSIKQVLSFRDKYLLKHPCYTDTAVTQEEARLILKTKLNKEPLGIGIIGTAGRKEDAAKMNKALYMKMCNHVIRYLNRLQLKPKEVELISGGAAWSDHVAVSLYLHKQASQLTLHLPCNYELSRGFIGKGNTAETAKYYHRVFSEKMGGPTMLGIDKAIDQCARITTSDSFLKRNLKIAKDSELLIAFTWGEGNQPKEKSGTLHTWNNSDAQVKIHVPLKEL
jgi:hypothetical protein